MPINIITRSNITHKNLSVSINDRNLIQPLPTPFNVRDVHGNLICRATKQMNGTRLFSSALLTGIPPQLNVQGGHPLWNVGDAIEWSINNGDLIINNIIPFMAVPLIAPPVRAPVQQPVVVQQVATSQHIVNGINRYSQCVTADPAHRYRSWEHCFDYFRVLKAGHQPRAAIPDTACVHLAFFLASWGMYRGNAFLLQKDYTVLKPVVDILLAPHYADLWRNDEMTLPPAQWPARAKLVMELAAEIEVALRLVNYVNSKGVQLQAKPSKILVTKIMLGTTGCIPAYDRYVIKGLKRERLSPSAVGNRSYLMLLATLRTYSADLTRSAAQLIRFHPPMKLMDMWLWERGR